MTRRSWGEGTVGQLKDGRWIARLRLGDGRRKAFYGKTKPEVIAKLGAAAHAHRRGLTLPGERQTLGEFVEKWISSLGPSVREKTAANYATLLRSHAIPVIGNVPLVKLGPADLQKLYDARRKSGAAPQSVLHLHRVVHRCLRDAERWGDVSRNVARLIDAPKVGRSDAVHALNAEEARALLQTASGDRLEPFLILALSTGMRLGELLGLTWRAVDLDRGTVSVLASLQPTAAGLVLMPPKTTRSRRVIDVEPRVVAALRRRRAAQQMERRVAGNAWLGTQDLVFTTETGEAIDGRTLIRKWFRPLLKRAGLPPIRLHDLRHTYASIALANGTHPKVVQEALGHSTIAITMDLYSHVTTTLGREAARTMGAALFG